MLQRIKTDSTKSPCGVVTKKVRDKAVRRLVKSDRNDNRDDPNRCQIDEIAGHSFGRVAGLIDANGVENVVGATVGCFTSS